MFLYINNIYEEIRMRGHFCAFHWQKWNRSGNDARESPSETTGSSFLMWLDLESAATLENFLNSGWIVV